MRRRGMLSPSGQRTLGSAKTAHRRGWAVLTLAALYALSTALVAVGGVTAHTSVAGTHASTTTMPAASLKLSPADNSTGNSSGGDDQGAGEDNNSSGENGNGNGVCAGGDQNSQGDDSQGDQGNNNSTSEDDQGDSGGNQTSSGNGTGAQDSAGVLGTNNTSEGDQGDNETGDSNDTGGSGDTNETGGNNTSACAGDPPVTFKALGLPSGSTWSVAAGNPPVTQTNVTTGHKGEIVFDVLNGTLNYSITGPAGFGVAHILGPGNPSQTSDLISGTTVLTIKFSPVVTLTFEEKGLPAGSSWSISIWSPLPHGGPTGQSASNTTGASGGTITFSVVKGPWKFNVTEVPTNFTAHPTHATVGVHGHHAVVRHLHFRPMPVTGGLVAVSTSWIAAPFRAWSLE